MEKEISKFKSVFERITGKASPEYVTCKSCSRRALKEVWDKNLNICPTCGKYRPMDAYNRLNAIFDEGTMKEFNKDMLTTDKIDFPGYEAKIKQLEKKTGINESAVTAEGRVNGLHIVAVVLDTRFLMGSMSSVVGEKVTRAVEYADIHRLPLVIFSASGGARMQEGIYSLMQMAKTSAAIEEFSEHGGLYISYMTHPTTGGVTASFATLGDITLAEPNALIGFAGPRVIEQTIGQKLPKGFQRSEYLLKHGFIDKIVPREQMKQTLYDVLKLHVDSRFTRRMDAI